MNSLTRSLSLRIASKIRSNKQLRILFVLNVLAIGGAEMFLLRKIAQLRKRGHFAALAYCEKRGEGVDGVLRKYLDGKDIYKITYEFASIIPLIQKLNINILHAVEGHPKFLQVAREVNPKIITLSTQTASVWDADKKFDHLTHTDAIVTMANDFLRIIMRHLQHPPIRTVVIENGVDISECDPDNLSKNIKRKILGPLFIPESAKVVLQIARINLIKNITASLRLAHKVCTMQDDCYFLIAGGHRQELVHKKHYYELLNLRNELKLENHFIFLGERTDIADLISVADCVLCTTVAHEGTPNALLEAMACGKPVIAFDCPGIRDVVQDNKTGLLAPVESIEELSVKIRTLLSDERLKRSLGGAARKLIRRRFGLDRAVDEYEKLYYELLKKDSRRLMETFKGWCHDAGTLIMRPFKTSSYKDK